MEIFNLKILQQFYDEPWLFKDSKASIDKVYYNSTNPYLTDTWEFYQNKYGEIKHQ